MAERFCKACKGWHNLNEPWPVGCRKPIEGKRSSLPVPMFIRDDMDPTEHVDGRFYTSKSAFRRVTKERGFIEVGDDPARLRSKPRPKPDTKANREALKRADYMVRNGIKI